MQPILLLPLLATFTLAYQNPPGTNFGLGQTQGWCTDEHKPALKIEDDGALLFSTPGMVATTLPKNKERIQCIATVDVLAPPDWQFKIRPRSISGQSLVTGEKRAEVQLRWMGAGDGSNGMTAVISNSTDKNFNLSLRSQALWRQPAWSQCTRQGRVVQPNFLMNADFYKSGGKPGFGLADIEQWRWDLEWRPCVKDGRGGFDRD